MTENYVTIMTEEFEKGDSGETVQGVTFIIDGKFKEVLDLLIKQNAGKYSDYKDIIKDALFNGINEMINEIPHAE